jgi:hypothetical protein
VVADVESKQKDYGSSSVYPSSPFAAPGGLILRAFCELQNSPYRVIQANASTWTYAAGPFAWDGTIYQATMTGLTAGVQYSYQVSGHGDTADARSFKAAPVPGPEVTASIAVMADMGTVQLSGFLVAEEIIREQ